MGQGRTQTEYAEGRYVNSDLMIETAGLTKAFGKRVAVDRLNLKVRRGLIHGFVGPNGAGKTTTMKMLVGSIKNTGGYGYVNGYGIGTLDARRSLGFSPEKPAFYGDMTGWEYLVYMGRLGGMKQHAAQKRASELMSWLGLGDCCRSNIGRFSAGMKQRLSLAQAMTHQPQLLILDEPTANLDPDGRMALIEKLRELRRELKMTIFISSHILPELEQLLDTVTLIDNGRIVVEDSVQGLKQTVATHRYALRVSRRDEVLKALQGQESGGVDSDDDGTIHLTSSNFVELQARVMEAVAEAGADIDYFGKEQATLQDVYRKKLGRDS